MIEMSHLFTKHEKLKERADKVSNKIESSAYLLHGDKLYKASNGTCICRVVKYTQIVLLFSKWYTPTIESLYKFKDGTYLFLSIFRGNDANCKIYSKEEALVFCYRNVSEMMGKFEDEFDVTEVN